MSPLTAAPQPVRQPRRKLNVAIEAREAIGLWRRKQAVLIDLRDWEAADATGWIASSFHCPPGEFAALIDPSSPLHARLFEPGKTFIFYGGHSVSPLAAARRARSLGLKDARALRGGLRAWRQAGGRIAGHPNSPFPALRSSIRFMTAYLMGKLRTR